MLRRPELTERDVETVEAVEAFAGADPADDFEAPTTFWDPARAQAEASLDEYEVEVEIEPLPRLVGGARGTGVGADEIHLTEERKGALLAVAVGCATPAERRAVEEHLRTCDGGCREYLAEQQAFFDDEELG